MTPLDRHHRGRAGHAARACATGAPTRSGPGRSTSPGRAAPTTIGPARRPRGARGRRGLGGARRPRRPCSPRELLMPTLRAETAAGILRRRFTVVEEPAKPLPPSSRCSRTPGIERVVLSRLRARRAETLTRSERGRTRPSTARRSSRARSATPSPTRRSRSSPTPQSAIPTLLARAIFSCPSWSRRSSRSTARSTSSRRCGRSCAGTRCSRPAIVSRDIASRRASRCASSSSARASPRISTRSRSRSSRPPPTRADHPRLGYRGASERHLAPPKTSQSEAELHGAFDDAIGSTDPADHQKLLGGRAARGRDAVRRRRAAARQPGQPRPAAGHRPRRTTRPCRRSTLKTLPAAGRRGALRPASTSSTTRTARPPVPAGRPRPWHLARLPGGRPRPDHRLPVRHRGLHGPLPRRLARASAVPARARRGGRARGRARRARAAHRPPRRRRPALPPRVVARSRRPRPVRAMAEPARR